MVKKITLIPGFLIVLLVAGGFAMSVFGSGKKITFKRDDSYILNPYIGYAPDAGHVALCESASLVYMNLLWSELEPEEGIYNWDYIEQTYNLERWRSEGKNLVLRFVCDIPTKQEHMDIPQWLYDKTGDGEFYDIEYGKGYTSVPDFKKDPGVLEASKRAHSHMGYRFRVESLELSTPYWGKETMVTAGFINDGVAPIYFDQKACLYIKLPEGADPKAYSEYCDSYGKEGSECEGMLRFETDIDLTELTSGKRASFSLILPKAVLEKGGTKIYAGIEDPKTGNPSISLAMKEDREGLLTLLFER